MPERACIFCGQRPTTREHLIPAWASDALFVDNPRKPTAGHWRRDKKDDYSWRAAKDKIEFVAKCVCADCNSGWVSDIEGAAKPAISEMIRGNEVLIGSSEDEAIGRWLCLKAIVERYARPSPMPVEESVRHYFYINREPPKSWHAWITCYKGNHPVFYQSGNLTTSYEPPLAPFPIAYTGVTFTLAIGYLGAKVFGVSEMMFFNDSALVLDVWPPPRLTERLAQHRPRQERRWPPPEWIGDKFLLDWSRSLPEYA